MHTTKCPVSPTMCWLKLANKTRFLTPQETANMNGKPSNHYRTITKTCYVYAVAVYLMEQISKAFFYSENKKIFIVQKFFAKSTTKVWVSEYSVFGYFEN